MFDKSRVIQAMLLLMGVVALVLSGLANDEAISVTRYNGPADTV